MLLTSQAAAKEVFQRETKMSVFVSKMIFFVAILPIFDSRLIAFRELSTVI